MTSHVIEQFSGKVVEVELAGTLTAADYENFVPLTEERIEQYGKIRMLVLFKDFHGWDAGALWDDIKFDVKHFRDIERLAIVGDSKWEKWMASFCKPFTTAEVRYFQQADLEAAREWIAASGV